MGFLHFGTYSSIGLELGQELKVEPGCKIWSRSHVGILITNLIMTCSCLVSLLAYSTQNHLPTQGWHGPQWAGPYTSTISQKNAPQVNLVEAFSQLRFPFLNYSRCRHSACIWPFEKDAQYNPSELETWGARGACLLEEEAIGRSQESGWMKNQHLKKTAIPDG